MILSVAMIVKNEERIIGRIILDCKKFADEIVVCDTGSTDGTVELCKKLGCKIVTHKWNNSFADARNTATNACSGDYVLWVDADDRIVKSQQILMRRLKRDFLQKKEKTAYLLQMITGTKSKSYPIDQLRVFPNIGKNLWSGRVHESVYNSMVEANIPMRVANIYIYHYGYNNEEVLENKLSRNLELLEKDIEDTNSSLKRSYLGMTLHGVKESDKALEVMSPVIDDKEFMQHKGQSFLYFMRLAVILYDTKEYKASWGACVKASKIFEDEPQPWALQAEIAYKKGEFELSRELAAECLKREHNQDAGIPVVANYHERSRNILHLTENFAMATT